MWTLLEELSKIDTFSLSVAVAYPGSPSMAFEKGNVKHYVLGQPPGRNHLRYAQREKRWVKEVIEYAKPDLIHVHGTERFYAWVILQHFYHVPLVISIQGLLNRYFPHYFKDLTPWEVFRSNRIDQILRMKGPLIEHFHRYRATIREARILRTGRYFIGRTEWDRAWTLTYNPRAKYFKCDEIIRPEFARFEWDLNKTERNSLIFTNATNPLKGIFVLLKALSILRQQDIDAKLTLVGAFYPKSGIGRILRCRIERDNLNSYVKLAGVVDGQQLASLMKESHLFVSPTYEDNSPNSLAEAMMVGMPCVTSYVGGIPSMVTDEVNALMFPPGDAALLAAKVRRILEDDNLARKLSLDARKTARNRHNKKRICEKTVEIYNELLERSRARPGRH